VKKLICILLITGLHLAAFSGNPETKKSVLKTIAGKITDANGESIPGAKILIKETGEMVFADFDGNFKLTFNTDKEYSIRVDNIGFEPLQVKSGVLATATNLSLTPLSGE
jgi:hypothetical protein